LFFVRGAAAMRLPQTELKKLPSIEDRGQTDRVIILAKPFTVTPLPCLMTFIFGPWQAGKLWS